MAEHHQSANYRHNKSENFKKYESVKPQLNKQKMWDVKWSDILLPRICSEPLYLKTNDLLIHP